MTEMDKIIDRIKKLHAKAESARSIGSLAEAETFAEAVQKMLVKYKLEMSLLSTDENNAADPLGRHTIPWAKWGVPLKSRRQKWLEKLTIHVGRAHFCRTFVIPGSNLVGFIGRQSDREVAEYVVGILARTTIEQADKAYRKERYAKWKGNVMHEAHGFRESFIAGFVQRLAERFKALAQEAARTPGMGLVVVKSGEELDKFVQQMKNSNKMNKKIDLVKLEPGMHDDGYIQGRRAANSVRLNPLAVGSSGAAKANNLKAPVAALKAGG